MAPKAVLVAGCCCYDDYNDYWYDMKYSIEQAYRVLQFRGIPKSNIRVLCNEFIDPDRDGTSERYANVTTTNINNALIWAQGSSDVIVAFSSHGGSNSISLTYDPVSSLSASTLNGWLDTLQATITGKMLVLLESCYSGTFIDELGATDRVVITSTSNDVTYYPGKFSDVFWGNVLIGRSVGFAFERAKSTLYEMTAHQQISVINDNGNTVGNESTDGTVADALLLEYGESYRMTSHDRRAVIICGIHVNSYDPSTDAILDMERHVYRGLMYLGYAAANVKVLGPSTLYGYDLPATKTNVTNSITSLAGCGEQIFVCYIGGTNSSTKAMQLSSTETMTPSELKAAYDVVQPGNSSSVIITVIDGPYTQSYLSTLKNVNTNEKRVNIIAANNHTGRYGAYGDASYSKGFGRSIIGSDDLLNAHILAYEYVDHYSGYPVVQLPSNTIVMDSNLDGVGSSEDDTFALTLTI